MIKLYYKLLKGGTIMKKIALTIALILIFATFVFVLTGCNEKTEGVVGKWAYTSYVYTFNSDKTGTYDASGTLMQFTYEDDGEKLSILYTGSTSPLVLKYRIDGNKLIITDSFGSDVEYTKK